MERKDFLKGIGILGLGSVLPVNKAQAAVNALGPQAGPACALIPTETAGPFPLDLTANSAFFRNDVREDRTGTVLNLKMKIVGVNDCLPMPNLRVNIWHCDKDGLYSGYDQGNNAGQAGKTYLRGYQMTDANGEVSFITIFPGWYPGRICHIHFQVYVSSVYAAVSQLTFDHTSTNALYAANPGEYTKGPDPLTVNTDGIFSDGYSYQVATLAPNSGTGGYDAYLEVGIQGSGTTGLAALEPETGGQFKLKQNFPNPFKDKTTIPFTLTNPSDATIILFDLMGRKTGEIKMNSLSAGEHEMEIDFKYLGIAPANYIYQLEVKNSNGRFAQCKMMTMGE